MVSGFVVVFFSGLALLGFGIAVDQTCHWRARRKLRREYEQEAGQP